MENPHIVIDNGSGVLKGGFAGENTPNVKFPAIVGRARGGAVTGMDAGKTEWIGDEAQKMRGVLKLAYPIKSGIVQDWDDMQLVWEYAFNNELRVDCSEHNVLLTEAPNNPKANREKMITMMFDTFSAAGTFISIQAVLSLYANGRTTGLVIDSGDGVTHTVPVFEGFSMPHAVRKNYIAGRAITEYFQTLLTADGMEPQGGAGAWFQIVASIKEKLAFVSLDYEADEQKADKSLEHTKAYELPDGSSITVNLPRFKAPEGMFKPELIKEGSEDKGVITIAYETIQECDHDVRLELYKNVILSGGSTLYPNMPDRIEAELNNICPAKDVVNIIAPADRYYSVWAGGATLCSLATFSSQWITKAEYEEEGPGIVHRKCQ